MRAIPYKRENNESNRKIEKHKSSIAQINNSKNDKAKRTFGIKSINKVFQ